jgi:hypothetical protein
MISQNEAENVLSLAVVYNRTQIGAIRAELVRIQELSLVLDARVNFEMVPSSPQATQSGFAS